MEHVFAVFVNFTFVTRCNENAPDFWKDSAEITLMMFLKYLPETVKHSSLLHVLTCTDIYVLEMHVNTLSDP